MDELIRIVEEGIESNNMKTLADVEEGIESEKRRILATVEEGFNTEKKRSLSKVEEGFESTKRSMVTQIKRYFSDWFQTSSRTSTKLQFRNEITRKILTGEKMKGEGGIPIEVALVDDSTGDVIVAEPIASAKVEFFLLNRRRRPRKSLAARVNFVAVN